eukprot:737361-Amphidinium_carterae.2
MKVACCPCFLHGTSYNPPLRVKAILSVGNFQVNALERTIPEPASVLLNHTAQQSSTVLLLGITGLATSSAP